MTRTNTRTTGLANTNARKTPRGIKILEKTVASTHLQNSHEQAEAWEQLAYKWSQLQPKAKISENATPIESVGKTPPCALPGQTQVHLT